LAIIFQRREESIFHKKIKMRANTETGMEHRFGIKSQEWPFKIFIKVGAQQADKIGKCLKNDLINTLIELE
jgi:hypothetical protein